MRATILYKTLQYNACATVKPLKFENFTFIQYKLNN